MNVTLTQKETGLLKDLKDQEKLCEEKYKKSAESANDPQLKQLFNDLAAVEHHHYDLLNQIGGGKVPTNTRAPSVNGMPFQQTYGMGADPTKDGDAYLCQDLLATEKHASALYDTCIFEFGQPELRQVLNTIQSDEQKHGEQIYKYMKTNNMYS